MMPAWHSRRQRLREGDAIHVHYQPAHRQAHRQCRTLRARHLRLRAALAKFPSLASAPNVPYLLAVVEDDVARCVSTCTWLYCEMVLDSSPPSTTQSGRCPRCCRGSSEATGPVRGRGPERRSLLERWRIGRELVAVSNGHRRRRIELIRRLLSQLTDNGSACFRRTWRIPCGCRGSRRLRGARERLHVRSTWWPGVSL